MWTSNIHSVLLHIAFTNSKEIITTKNIHLEQRKQDHGSLIKEIKERYLTPSQTQCEAVVSEFRTLPLSLLANAGAQVELEDCQFIEINSLLTDPLRNVNLNQI
jgi:hypothetical protein